MASSSASRSRGGQSAGAGTQASSTGSSSISSNIIQLSDEPAFDMLVLGCGGGPAENDLSAYWVKPAGQAWNQGFTSVDGGSCLGALIRLLKSHPDTFRDFLDHPTSATQQESIRTSSVAQTAVDASILLRAGQIYDWLQSFLVTHAHWDHISGLVLSSSSGSSKQKTVYGSKQTISNLSNAMNGGLWPVLGSYEIQQHIPYIWRNIEAGFTVQPCKGISASIMPLSHGKHPQGTSYESSVYFLENDKTGKCILIFGDVEADSVSGLHLCRDVWQEAGRRIAERRLSSLVIECSYTSSRRKEQLYGHLSPIFIAEELRVLASYIPPLKEQSTEDLKGRLKGMTVCICHVKDPTFISQEETSTLAMSALIPAPEDDAPASKRTRVSPSTSISAPVSSATSTPSHATRPRIRTRSSSSRTAASGALEMLTPTSAQQTEESLMKTFPSSSSWEPPTPISAVEPTSLPEGIKNKIYNELIELEGRDLLGVRYLMLEQGMRIAF